MLHNDKDTFRSVLQETAEEFGFPQRLMEKDYYLTLMLSEIHKELSESLIFKGGTCLNKVYYTYYRLSEDLDFTLRMPSGKITRGIRRKTIQPIKDSILSFAESLDMHIEGFDNAGRNESKQYIYYFTYDSVIVQGKKRQSVKFEIGLRFNPILPVEKKPMSHAYTHPFTGEPLFETSPIICLSLKELVAEKLRAACTRCDIVPRDFYDLDYLIKQGFDFKDEEFISLFKKKLKEDGHATDLKKYAQNLGRSEKEINDMKSRIEDEFFPVLAIHERKIFDIDEVLNKFAMVLNEHETYGAHGAT